ncbi:MAG: DivIVA domain-containing protein [Candidatus Cloacimonetes bacterium]|nr:DivIVA domain-containing protein [Candidatus Cloacimonadota bacterium]
MTKENDISSAEILTRNFSTSMFGYKKGEVEAFLEKVAVYIEELEKQLEQYSKLKAPVKKEEKHEEELKVHEELISKTLMMAERTKDDVIRNAHKEAENIVKEADLKGKKMLAEAKNLVSVLEHQIYNLEEQKRMFLLKFKAEMEAQLIKINEDELMSKSRSSQPKDKVKIETDEKSVEESKG